VRSGALRPAAQIPEEADADVVDREAFEEGVAADEVVRHEQFVAVAVGQNLLDAADALAVNVDDAGAEEQFQLHFSLL
jgi:hypothetical protein